MRISASRWISSACLAAACAEPNAAFDAGTSPEPDLGTDTRADAATAGELDADPSPDWTDPRDATGPFDLGGELTSLCETAPDPDGYEHQVHHFENEAGTRRIRLQRDFAGLGGGLTSAWTLAWMRIDDGPCVTEVSQLDYVWTHHNFEDEAHLVLDGIEHIVSAELPGAEPFAIQTTYRAVRTSDQALVAGPEALLHVAGPSWPF